jgi:hypothetical protein
MVIAPSKNNSTLNSWKEIATFLGRGVRTVQRWERELGLPVRRLRRSEHSPVFAFRGELEAWLNSRPGQCHENLRSQKGNFGCVLQTFTASPNGRCDGRSVWFASSVHSSSNKGPGPKR